MSMRTRVLGLSMCVCLLAGCLSTGVGSREAGDDPAGFDPGPSPEAVWLPGEGAGRPVRALEDGRGTVLVRGHDEIGAPVVNAYSPATQRWHSASLTLIPAYEVTTAQATRTDSGILAIFTVAYSLHSDSLWLLTDTVWAAFDGAGWEVEMNPGPWKGKGIYGVSYRHNVTWVLTRDEVNGYALWNDASGSWRQELLPFLSATLGGRAALVVNDSHVFVAGPDGAGNAILVHKGLQDSVFTLTILRVQPALGGPYMIGHSLADGRPWFAWDYISASPNSPWAAVPTGGGWQAAEVVPGRHYVESLAVTEGGAILVLRPDARPEELWRHDGTEWVRCDLQYEGVGVRLFGLLSDAGEAAVHYSSGISRAMVPLDVNSPTCLATDDADLPSSPPAP